MLLREGLKVTNVERTRIILHLTLTKISISISRMLTDTERMEYTSVTKFYYIFQFKKIYSLTNVKLVL